MFDAVGERVLEARFGGRAVDADLFGYLDPNPVAGEEKVGRLSSTIAFGHPRRVHELAPSTSLTDFSKPYRAESERKYDFSPDFPNSLNFKRPRGDWRIHGR